MLYRLPNIDFDSVIRMLRENFRKELFEGRITLENKIKAM